MLGFLARFLEGNGEGNVLSTPNLLTLDNEEAKIVIGQNVPFVTGQYTNTGSRPPRVNPFQTIERKDVGLTLRVRPQISENGTVQADDLPGGVERGGVDRQQPERPDHQQAHRSSRTCWSTTAT